MKKIKQLRSIIIYASILALIIGITSAFSHVKPDPTTKANPTSYYWYDVTGNWLGRQNTVAEEMALTGLDESTSNPKTLQEIGYDPADVVGYPPVPLDTAKPVRWLYSHP
jgi:hypothetical protein